MITKRWLGYLLTVLLVGFGSAQAATQQSWRFKVYLDGQEIGYHHFKLMQHDDATHIAVNAQFDVKFLFINAYSYMHQNYEVWHGECLHSIHSQTDVNGDAMFVHGDRDDNALSLRTPEGENRVTGCIKTFAYWDADFLQSTHLLNAQTGELLPVQVQELGMETIQVRSTPVKATHYRLHTEEFSIDLWYSADRRDWLALQSTMRDGTVLRYQIL